MNPEYRVCWLQRNALGSNMPFTQIFDDLHDAESLALVLPVRIGVSAVCVEERQVSKWAVRTSPVVTQ